MSKDLSDDNSLSNSVTSQKNNAFIDHRQYNDLAQIHSPSRTRRRSQRPEKPDRSKIIKDAKDRPYPINYEREQLPLTNQNLRNFNSTTESVSPKNSSFLNDNTIAIDMDQLNRESQHSERPDNINININVNNRGEYDDTVFHFNDNASYNSLEFGESNPSSEHSSDSTSLDDVCFADYYDDNHETTTIQWPDLKVLQEFIDNEKVYEQGYEHDDHVNFRLDQKKSNEADTISSSNSIKFTPTPIQPWDKPNLTHNSSFNPILNKRRHHEDYRFTYFRDDLSKTIHSSNLSGLLGNHTTDEERVNLRKKWRDEPENDLDDTKPMTLQDLFDPEYYSDTFNALNTELNRVEMKPSSANLPDNNLQVKSVLGKQFESQTPRTGTMTDSLGPTEYKPFWLDVSNPTEEEMKVLSKTFGIHPLTTEDIFLGEVREKVELFKGYYFICFTSFDIVYERRKQLRKEHERKLNKLQELQDANADRNFLQKIYNKIMGSGQKYAQSGLSHKSKTSSVKSTGKKIREGELSPLSMYMIVFKDAVITFHFSATPHPINVRRRARILKDYLTVSSDWISYALIDDITDSFAPMIESIEEEVNAIEEAILRMHAGDNDDSDDADSDDESINDKNTSRKESTSKKDSRNPKDIFYKRSRSKSTVGKNGYTLLDNTEPPERNRRRSVAVSSITSSSQTSSKILGWKRKGDMLRRIGECRKRVMSVLRLLGSKADVIKGFSKRLNETELYDKKFQGIPQSRQEITMYLGDIQDHIITMVQSLNHYEKLLARFHSNYLAQINIDMTKVNNDTNDALGKISILGSIVLPINVVTGLWGMNCLVPGQGIDDLTWFFSILACMAAFSFIAYNYAKRAYGL